MKFNREFLKKHGSIIMLIGVLVCFILLSFIKVDKDEVKPQNTSAIKNTATSTPLKIDNRIISDKQLENKEYEGIARNYFNAKNRAVDDGYSIVAEFIEDKEFEKQVKEDIKNKEKIKFDVVVCKEVISIDGETHKIKALVIKGKEQKEIILTIKVYEGELIKISGEE